MSRFQEAEVASLLSQVAWTKQKLRVRLSWGYCQTLEVDVVRIELRNTQSNPLAFQHQVMANGQNKPTLMRKPSPPLGVPSESVRLMESIHDKYISRIVDSGLERYVMEGAYNDDDSDLPKRLLGTICHYYQRCSEADEEVRYPGWLYRHEKLTLLSANCFVIPLRCISRALSCSAV